MMFMRKLTLFLVAIIWQTGALALDLDLEVVPLNDTHIAWAETGDVAGPPVVLIMGLGSSHSVWPEDLVEGLAKSGMRVILLDNRDVGLSQRYDDLGNPVMWWNLLKVNMGFQPWTAYTLDDMAKDVVALMDHLEVKRAHVVGASMGGMIAQLVAINHPDRARSLVSIMSSSGAPHLPPATKGASEQFDSLAESEGDEIQDAHAWGFYPEAMPRQFMAVLASGDRSDRLALLSAPTLVIHGMQDSLLPVEHGRHTAEVIPGARLEEIDGMGHYFPEQVLDHVLELIVDHVRAN
jgi:pimeloyl-ACP methyl ester carboxylesterase